MGFAEDSVDAPGSVVSDGSVTGGESSTGPNDDDDSDTGGEASCEAQPIAVPVETSLGSINGSEFLYTTALDARGLAYFFTEAEDPKRK